MFAVVGRWKLDAAQAGQQREVLTQRIVPGVKTAEGFVSGYWTEPTETGDAYSFIVFDELESAHAFAESVKQDRHDRGSHGVEGEGVVVVEIAAHG